LEFEAVGKDQLVALGGVGPESFGLLGRGSGFHMADLYGEGVAHS
jgi:hypothetical protein